MNDFFSKQKVVKKEIKQAEMNSTEDPDSKSKAKTKKRKKMKVLKMFEKSLLRNQHLNL